MPATWEFVRELKRRLGVFSVEDTDNTVAILNLGAIIYNMGWFNRLEWYNRALKEIVNRYGNTMPESLRRDLEVAVLHHSMAFALLGRMDSKKAYRNLKVLKRYTGKNAFVIYSAYRYFYEYLGHTPLAYKYLNRMYNLFNKDPNRPERIAWKGCREIVFLLCLGKKPSSREIYLKDCESVLREGKRTLEAFEMTLLVNTHTLSYMALMGLERPMNVLDAILRSVKMGMERNYDHITLRILTAFVPLLLSIGKRTLARSLVKSAIYTSRTERNRYMYEWFTLYDMALEGRTEGLDRRIRVYAGRKYVAHEILARKIAHHLGVDAQENGRIAHEKALRYGGVCYERMADLLFR